MLIKVIDVDNPKKLVASACYVKQHVCLSATICTLDKPPADKQPLFRKVPLPLFDTRVRRPPWTYRVRTWFAKIYIQCWKFHVQIVLVYLQQFQRNSLLKCVLQPKITKKFTIPIFWGSRSFKVIDVDIPKKLVTSACYDKQHVCAYLQPFSR